MNGNLQIFEILSRITRGFFIYNAKFNYNYDEGGEILLF